MKTRGDTSNRAISGRCSSGARNQRIGTDPIDLPGEAVASSPRDRHVRANFSLHQRADERRVRAARKRATLLPSEREGRYSRYLVHSFLHPDPLRSVRWPTYHVGGAASGIQPFAESSLWETVSLAVYDTRNRIFEVSANSLAIARVTSVFPASCTRGVFQLINWTALRWLGNVSFDVETLQNRIRMMCTWSWIRKLLYKWTRVHTYVKHLW